MPAFTELASPWRVNTFGPGRAKLTSPCPNDVPGEHLLCPLAFWSSPPGGDLGVTLGSPWGALGVWEPPWSPPWGDLGEPLGSPIGVWEPHRGVNLEPTHWGLPGVDTHPIGGAPPPRTHTPPGVPAPRSEDSSVPGYLYRIFLAERERKVPEFTLRNLPFFLPAPAHKKRAALHAADNPEQNKNKPGRFVFF
jgi:hypothetical protein